LETVSKNYKAKPEVIFACGPETRRDLKIEKNNYLFFFPKLFL